MADVPTLTVRPGDVVVADFPGVAGIERRPALVVSTDAYHRARPDTILGLLTGQVAAATAPTDYRLRDWRSAGLYTPTAFRTFLITMPREDIVAIVGHLTRQDWAEVSSRMRLAVAV